MANIIRKNSILTMLDFDDCLVPNTIGFYRPVLREMLQQELRRFLPGMTEAEYLAGEETSLATYGSYFRHWEIVLNKDATWTNTIYRAMVPAQQKAIMAGLQFNPAVTQAVGNLVENGHVVYIVTHSYLEYCWPLAEHFGLSRFIPQERVMDLARAGHNYKSSGTPYRMVREIENREFSLTNMADDVVANLKPLKEMGIVGHFISETAPQPAEIGHFDFHHSNILTALNHMATQNA